MERTMKQPRRYMSFDEELSRPSLELYGYAVLAIAGAEGELGRGERESLIDAGRSRGVDDAVLTSWQPADWQEVELEDTLVHLRNELSPPMRRLLIYDAIRAARADGVIALQERKAIDDAAEILEVDAGTVKSLLALVELEESANALRRSLLLL